MKVLQCMSGAQYGGAEAFFTRLVIALDRAGVQQRVAIRDHEVRTRKLREAGIEPDLLRYGRRFDPMTRFALDRMIREFKPDIVLSWMNRATSAVPKSRGRFVHVGRLGGYYNLKYYKNCDHLIANTADIADYLVKNGWREDRVHYLPNFVSGDIMPPVPRSTFYTPERAPLILSLGRLHENKGFDTLLRAVSRVPNVYLWLAGEGPLRGELEALAEQLGIKPRVRFLGWRDDVEALFAAADLFVSPSRHEPLGNVVIEAWAQGVPVVATDTLGPGTLIENGETGLLVPVDDVPSLARAIKRTVEDDDFRHNMAVLGRGVYERNFTEATVVESYINFFEQVTS